MTASTAEESLRRTEEFIETKGERFIASYDRLLGTLEAEFTCIFGGCTLQCRLDGNYLSQSGEPIPDRVNRIYTDMPYSFSRNLSLLSDFADELRTRADEMLDEEAILAVVMPVSYSE